MNNPKVFDALSDLLASATHQCDSDEVVAQAMYRFLMPMMSFESSSLNLCQVESRKTYQLPELKCYFYRQPKRMASSCQKNCWNDSFSPFLLKYPYHVLDGSRFLSADMSGESILIIYPTVATLMLEMPWQLREGFRII